MAWCKLVRAPFFRRSLREQRGRGIWREYVADFFSSAARAKPDVVATAAALTRDRLRTRSSASVPRSCSTNRARRKPAVAK